MKSDVKQPRLLSFHADGVVDSADSGLTQQLVYVKSTTVSLL